MTRQKKFVYIETPSELRYTLAGWQNGLCRGLQILLYRFNSGTGLQNLFRLSSAVEQSAVYRLVACSNQAAGDIKKNTIFQDGVFFYGFCYLNEQRPKGACSERIASERNSIKHIPAPNKKAVVFITAAPLKKII